MIEDHLSGEQIQKIEEELNAENKIRAVQQVREFTGLGLKESKDLVDEHIQRLMERDPEKYGHLVSRGSSGCFGVLFLMIAPAALALTLIL